MERVIFHVDVNSAFLSWSAVKRLREDENALDLRTVPSVVCGDVESRHGIVTAKSIPAKKFGIETAEPVMSALRKCPDLILVKSDFTVYREYSHAFIEVLKKYSPLVEQVSIDEAYLDVTGTEALYKHLETKEYKFPLSLAMTIKNEIRDTLGFTVNVGVAENKLLAKTASDFSKPDKVHTLYQEEIPVKFWPMQIGAMHGCGKQTAAKLNSLGIRTIGDAAHMDRKILKLHLGDKAGDYIWYSANGISKSEVQAEDGEVKSVSNEITTSPDITGDNYKTEAYPILRTLSDSVGKRLRRKGLKGSTITLTVKTAQFKRLTRQLSLYSSTDSSDEIYQAADTLFKQMMLGEDGLFVRGEALRLLGVGVSKLDHGEYEQLSLFDLSPAAKAKDTEELSKPQSAKKGRLDAALDEIRRRFGDDAVVRGSLMGKKPYKPHND